MDGWSGNVNPPPGSHQTILFTSSSKNKDTNSYFRMTSINISLTKHNNTTENSLLGETDCNDILFFKVSNRSADQDLFLINFHVAFPVGTDLHCRMISLALNTFIIKPCSEFYY